MHSSPGAGVCLREVRLAWGRKGKSHRDGQDSAITCPSFSLPVLFCPQLALVSRTFKHVSKWHLLFGVILPWLDDAVGTNCVLFPAFPSSLVKLWCFTLETTPEQTCEGASRLGWGGEACIYPHCGQNHPLGWGPGLSETDKVSWDSTNIHLPAC